MPQLRSSVEDYPTYSATRKSKVKSITGAGFRDCNCPNLYFDCYTSITRLQSRLKGLKSLYQPANSYEEWLILIKDICKQFKVSSQPVIYQLSDLRWVDDELKDKLLKEKKLSIKQNAKIDPEIAGDFSPGTKERLTEFIRKGLSWHFVELATQAYSGT